MSCARLYVFPGIGSAVYNIQLGLSTVKMKSDTSVFANLACCVTCVSGQQQLRSMSLPYKRRVSGTECSNISHQHRAYSARWRQSHKVCRYELR